MSVAVDRSERFDDVSARLCAGLGSQLTARIPEKILRVSLVAVLLSAGTKLLMG